MNRKGPWSPAEVDRFLANWRIPVRLAVNGASGHPVLASLWYAHLDGAIWCATKRDSSIATSLARDPRCAFEIAPESRPYHGVRGQALAALHEARGEEILRRLIERYLDHDNSAFARWLLSRAAGETAIALSPLTLVSWDYRKRMSAPRELQAATGLRR
jgi:nitroimidazol reductase NimA-like FMN-containing flavoprotein (pyridoxamine 5'-phosphate oxidase superfamily)